MSGGTLYTSAKRPGGQNLGGKLCTTTPASPVRGVGERVELMPTIKLMHVDNTKRVHAYFKFIYGNHMLFINTPRHRALNSPRYRNWSLLLRLNRRTLRYTSRSSKVCKRLGDVPGTAQ